MRTTDLGSFNSSSGQQNEPTNNHPKTIQHWAIVVHFPRGNKTFVFEAWEDENNKLVAGRADENVDVDVFKNAEYFGTHKTSPKDLLDIARKNKNNGRKYSILLGVECQLWAKSFIRDVSTDLYGRLRGKLPMLPNDSLAHMEFELKTAVKQLSS